MIARNRSTLRYTLLCAVAAASIASMMAAKIAYSDEINWGNLRYDRESRDEDIKIPLRKILESKNISVNFRPDVKGVVNFNFKDMLAQAAFNKIIAEFNLEWSFDAATNTVTISAPQRRKFIALAHVKPEQFRDVARKLLRFEVQIDAENDLVLAAGSNEQLTQLEELAQKMDQAAAARDLASNQSLETDTIRGLNEAKIEAAKLEAEVNRKALEELRDTDTEIIKLRFATVGPTTQTFQGETVTIPGIDATLKSMLGIAEEKIEKAAAPATNNGVGAQPVPMQDLARVRRELMGVPPIISIDPRSNSVIVRGSRRAIKEVRGLIQQLDKPVPLVEIEVMIVRARRGVSEQLGVKWGGALVGSQGGEANNFGFGVSTGIASGDLVAPRSALPGQERTIKDINSDTGIASTQTSATLIDPVNPFSLLPTTLGGTLASFVFRGSEWALQAQINALAEANKLQTISAPRVVTLNNLVAKITNDRSQYLLIPAGLNAAGSYKEVKAGLSLSITPSLIRMGGSGTTDLVRMAINASDKDVTLSAGRPTLSGNEVQTQVVIPTGKTFVMGGLMNDSRLEADDGVPGLMDLPVLGALFRSKSSTSDLQETIFFITPKIVNPADEFARDVAERRYLDGQRAKLSDMRLDVQTGSQLIDLDPAQIEEDE